MREGDFVCLAYGAGNRNDRKFEDPDVYDIYRKPRGHLGFRRGTRACLGAAIARLAVKSAMEEFLQRVPDFEQAEAEMPWIPSTDFRSPVRLLLACG